MDYLTNELYHHGIKGQKWYVRRYQNEDGSLTPAGRQRYLKSPGEMDYVERSITNRMDKLASKATKYGDRAKSILDSPVSRVMSSDVAAVYILKANKALKKMEAGGTMLKAYRDLPKRKHDYLRDDTSYNFQIRKGITDAASVNMNKKERKELKKNAKAYRFSYREQMGKL